MTNTIKNVEQVKAIWEQIRKARKMMEDFCMADENFSDSLILGEVWDLIIHAGLEMNKAMKSAGISK